MFGECFPVLLIFTVLALWIAYNIRRYQIVSRFAEQLRADPNMLYVGNLDFQQQVMPSNRGAVRWRHCLPAITSDTIRLYPIRGLHVGDPIILPRDTLRWFGRPKKYHNQRNELWLHVEQNAQWSLIKLRAFRYQMQQVVRALKVPAGPDLVTAYRRQRPYVHYPPVYARPASQDIYGTWSLGDPMTLYVMPLYVVLFKGDRVERRLPMEHIQQIAALHRLDDPGMGGLITLQVSDEKLSFAVDDHERVAAAISDAAKRSLEAPVIHKKKAVDDDEWE